MLTIFLRNTRFLNRIANPIHKSQFYNLPLTFFFDRKYTEIFILTWINTLIRKGLTAIHSHSSIAFIHKKNTDLQSKRY